QLQQFDQRVRAVEHPDLGTGHRLLDFPPPLVDLCQDWHKRKNWLFSDTPKGDTASAQLYSLVETAKANGQEPYTYLRHILEHLPHAKAVEDYNALLPWNYTPALSR
ncbi:transposase domain-containing protein, partial [Pseudomonas turukhanskensis]|uniref:transposase domain-containing protein n=1 Tax=Pseudomonas turukhanskensis TaxID=1806536 RepID=UPI0022F32E37